MICLTRNHLNFRILPVVNKKELWRISSTHAKLEITIFRKGEQKNK
jgi:hypothetical protein